MIRPGLGCGIGLLVVAIGCSDQLTEDAGLFRATPIPNQVDGVVFEAGNWEPHLAAGEAGVSWGNHRAVVTLEESTGGGEGASDAAQGAAEAVLVTVPWRRRDRNPESKAVIVVDARTGEPVRNAVAVRVENASGDIVFQPNPGSSTYHVYYMPWQSTGGYYPTVTYPTPAMLGDLGRGAAMDRASPSRADQTGRADLSWEGMVSGTDPTWEREVRSLRTASLQDEVSPFRTARTTRIQSVDAFHSFFPMEVAATPDEEAAFMDGAEDGWRLVPEHRDYPVRMRHLIPQHWVGGEMGRSRPITFRSRVRPGEAFTFQLALVAGEESLADVRVGFHDFDPALPEHVTCFNCEGTDERGRPFTKPVSVPAGSVQPLWLGIRVPDDQRRGPIEGRVTVSAAGRGSKTVHLTLEVSGKRVEEGGADQPELMTRLAWLNSTVGTDPDFIIEPFEPVGVEGPDLAGPRALSVLGRRIELGESGLPAGILSYFTPALTSLAEVPEPILARPMALNVTVGGEPEHFTPSRSRLDERSPGRVRWTAESRSANLGMEVTGTLEYDGMLDYRIRLVAETAVDVDEISLPVSLVPDAAVYMLGLGRKGGRRPASVDWKWAVENHQEGVWLGGIHKGLQYVLRDENYVRPLNTNFYRNQPLNLPPSWFNQGRGGIRIVEEGGPDESGRAGSAPSAVTAVNYSGPRSLQAGDTLHFNIRLLITPFKPVDTAAHFDTRFVHMYVPVDSVRSWGGTVVNIHHANEINPYINYPFFNLEQQKAYIDEAHSKGIKVKLYNTIRELTYRAHELFALRSLGDEILNDGEGGGHSWMQEHMEDGYHSAWHAWRVDDAAMLDKGTSRWTNYYIEGLSWLAEHQQIDGLYLDDIAFSRETVKRLVGVLDEHRDEVVIDLHSANQFNVRDGFTNSAMLYMEHFPFISRLWFGEYFEYDLDEDYWLTEVSGLPFGLMGEMLQDGGHPYRGMLYGMTARMYGNVDPRPVWSMMNDFGISDSRMSGYWLGDAPVTTDHPRVLATTYSRPGSVLIALASWSEVDEVVALNVDWQALGFQDGSEAIAGGGGPAGVRTIAPGVDGLQPASQVDLSAVSVPANGGLFILVSSDPAGVE